MCDRSLCRPGYVNSLLNLPSASDAFYFPGLRANGSRQLAASLPALPYPRGSVAWTPPTSHAFASSSSSSHPSPYLSAAAGNFPLALHPSGGGGPKEAPEGHPKYYAQEGAAKQERSRGGREGAAGAQQLVGEAGAAVLKEDLKPAINLNVTPPPAAAQLSYRAALQDGLPWCPTQGRSRKKRKPYTKQQVAALESEFVLNEFINRQKRKELSHRLHLSDQQVKIWFQNRRMKKKRVVMREQALSLY